jgi:hypothetical protein
MRLHGQLSGFQPLIGTAFYRRSTNREMLFLRDFETASHALRSSLGCTAKLPDARSPYHCCGRPEWARCKRGFRGPVESRHNFLADKKSAHFRAWMQSGKKSCHAGRCLRKFGEFCVDRAMNPRQATAVLQPTGVSKFNSGRHPPVVQQTARNGEHGALDRTHSRDVCMGQTHD